MMKSLKGDSATMKRLRAAAERVAPNRSIDGQEVPETSAGSLLKRAKLESEEASKLLRS